MAGKIHQTIQKIIDTRSNGNPALAQTIRTKLLMKGIDCSKWGEDSDDDPVMLEKVQRAATELGVLV